MAVSDQSVATTGTQLDQLCINTIRTLSMDAVQKANSGHPGAPMALAPVAYCLWQQFLRYDPDRSALAESRPLRALQRTRLHAALFPASSGGRAAKSMPDGKVLSTPAVSLDDIKSFRQLGSKTPGHPEYGVTTGVETTTGPLGQGVANSVGMAIAERWLAGAFQSSRIRPLQLQHLGLLRRRRHDGRNLLRSRLHRRTSAAFESLLDLRQQSHHDRRQHRSRLRRRCGRPLRRLWMGCPARPRCQRLERWPMPTATRSASRIVPSSSS